MSPLAFIQTLEAQLKVTPGRHTIYPPAVATSLEKIPPNFAELLALSNGVDLRHTWFDGELFGAAFEIPSADEVVSVGSAMYGKESAGHPAISSDWLAVGRHTDASYYVAFDPGTSTYFTIDPILPRETSVIASSCNEYLDWLGQFIEN